MSAPTNVITNTNTSDKASNLKLIEQEKVCVLIHSHKVCIYASFGGGDCRNLSANIIVRIAEVLTVPAPIKAITFLGRFLPAIESTRKPNNGIAGITYRSFSI